MTTPKDKFKPVKCTTNLPLPTDWPPPVLTAKRPIVYQLRRTTDWFAVLGVGSAVLAFLLWAWPECWLSAGCERMTEHWFSSAERLPATAAFLVLSFILLLLHRR